MGSSSRAYSPGTSDLLQNLNFVEDDAWIAELRRLNAPPQLMRLGEYVLLGVLGSGGQGVVYRAVQPRTGRVVALKRVAAGAFITPEMRARFEREIESIASLDHPNVVTVYGTELIDGQPVLSMKWIDGVPFDAWARPAQAPRDIREVLHAYIQVCEAVRHAHDRGVIHRDLKPSNILVDRAGEPHVLDFGLARRFEEAGASEISITHSGMFLGTSGYASPEQIVGRPQDVDVRSDVFSLGVILFRALTGASPAGVVGTAAERLAQLEQRARESPARLNSKLDADLCAILRKAVQPDRALRYPSALALAEDLQRYLRHEGVLAHPPSRVYALRKLARKYSWTVRAAAAVFLTLCGLITWMMLLYVSALEERWKTQEQTDRANEARIIAERAQEGWRSDAGVARAMSGFVLGMLDTVGGGGRSAGGEITVKNLLDRSSGELGRAGLPPIAEAAVRTVVANSYRSIGNDSAAEPNYRRALDLYRAIDGEESPKVAAAYDNLGRVLRRLGRMEEAAEAVESAWRIHERVTPAGDPYFAMTANSLGLINRSLKRYEEAKRWFLEALKRYEQCFGPRDVNLPTVLMNLGVALVSAQEFAEAEARFEEGLRLAREIHRGTLQIDTLMLASNLADVRALRGDPFGDAEQLFCESQRGMEELLGKGHLRIAEALDHYARLLIEQERFPDALWALDESIWIGENNERWEYVAELLSRRAAVVARFSGSADALQSLGDGIARNSGCLPQTSQAGIALRVQLAETLRAADRTDEAIAVLASLERDLVGESAPLDRIAPIRELMAQSQSTKSNHESVGR